MKVAIILAALLLQGCYQAVNQLDFMQAARACGGFDNVFEIRAEFGGNEYVTCKEGKKWRLQ